MSPFHPVLLGHNEAQLDFILEMYAHDNPKELTVTRAGQLPERLRETATEAAWANVLIGPAHDKFMVRHLPPEAVMRRLRGGNQVPVVHGPGGVPVTLPSTR